MWAVGRTTGYVAAATFTVTPTISMSPTKVAAGDTTTVSGMGFVPGETVAVTFPGGSAVMVVADAVGNVTVAVVSPPEPFPGGVLTATAPSATVTTSYTVQPVIDEVGPQGPMNMPLSLTGWAALETVTFSMDGQSQTYVTDMNGSLDVTVTLPSTWGTHVLSVVGSTSGISMTDQMTFTASMTINPSSGPVGTAVAIDSGPGWVPGSQLTLTWAPPNQQILTADSTGAIHTTFVIPTHDRGVVYFKLSDTVLGVTVKLPFTVT